MRIIRRVEFWQVEGWVSSQLEGKAAFVVVIIHLEPYDEGFAFELVAYRKSEVVGIMLKRVWSVAYLEFDEVVSLFRHMEFKESHQAVFGHLISFTIDVYGLCCTIANGGEEYGRLPLPVFLVSLPQHFCLRGTVNDAYQFGTFFFGTNLQELVFDGVFHGCLNEER